MLNAKSRKNKMKFFFNSLKYLNRKLDYCKMVVNIVSKNFKDYRLNLSTFIISYFSEKQCENEE